MLTSSITSGMPWSLLHRMAAAVAGEYPNVWIMSNDLLRRERLTERASAWNRAALENRPSCVRARRRFKSRIRLETILSIWMSSTWYVSDLLDPALLQTTSKSMSYFSLSRRYVRWARRPEPEYSGRYLLETTSTFNGLCPGCCEKTTKIVQCILAESVKQAVPVEVQIAGIRRRLRNHAGNGDAFIAFNDRTAEAT